MKRQSVNAYSAALASLALAAAAGPANATKPTPFKQTNIHFETNATACDMGIQISFDTNGVTWGLVEDPNDRIVYTWGSVNGLEVTHDVTEGFTERVEPPVIDLESALGCEPSEDAVPLSDLLGAWPVGTYDFEGFSGGTEFEGYAKLNHRIPAGAQIVTPLDGSIVRHDQPLFIQWKKVTGPLLPSLGPVEIVGYHVLVVDVTKPTLAPGKTKKSFDADVSKSETTFTVSKEYLDRGRIYELEILATEKGGNQTITEGGVFCTPPIVAADCEKP